MQQPGGRDEVYGGISYMIILTINRKVPTGPSSCTYEPWREQLFVNSDEEKAKELRDEIRRYYGDKNNAEVTKIDGKQLI